MTGINRLDGDASGKMIIPKIDIDVDINELMRKDEEFWEFAGELQKEATNFEKDGGNYRELVADAFHDLDTNCKFKLRTPLAGWIGGKSKLSRQIVALFPDYCAYLEVFCGGAAVYFQKPKYGQEVLNDINGDIVNFFSVIQNRIEDFLHYDAMPLLSRDRHSYFCDPNFKARDEIEKAWRFFYLSKSAYYGKFYSKNPTFRGMVKKKGDIHGIRNLTNSLYLVKLTHKRLQATTIENLPYDQFIRKYDYEHALFYLDPPYVDKEKLYDRTFEGKLPVFTNSDHYNLRNILQGIKGKFLLSYPDCDFIRELYSGFNFLQIRTQYGLGSIKGRKRNSVKELIISNYDFPLTIKGE